MSHIPSGGYLIYFGLAPSNARVSYWYQPGWPGVTFIQAEATSVGANLVSVPGEIYQDKNGNYTFWTKVYNWGPNYTYFNMQVSNKILLEQLKLTLPAQPPPRIRSRRNQVQDCRLGLRLDKLFACLNLRFHEKTPKARQSWQQWLAKMFDRSAVEPVATG